MINKYPGNCNCGVRVEAGAGEAVKVDGRWTVLCAACRGAGAVTSAAGVTTLERAATDEAYTLLSGHTASPYQTAVFDHFRYGRGSRIIKAVAGSGKTTTMKNAIRWLSERAHVQLLAFNVEATDQLKSAIAELEAMGEKSYKNVRANSFNSLGMGAVRRFLALPDGEIKIEADKVRKILRARFDVDAEARENFSRYSAFAVKLGRVSQGGRDWVPGTGSRCRVVPAGGPSRAVPRFPGGHGGTRRRDRSRAAGVVQRRGADRLAGF